MNSLEKINSNLIFDIIDSAKNFKMSNVKIFTPKECPIYSLASAVALQTYLTNVIGLNATIVLSEENKVTPLKDFICPEDPESILDNQNDFISVVLDCHSLSQIENDSYNKTFIIFEVSGEKDTKGFGVKDFNSKHALCSAEIIYNGVMAHSLIAGYIDNESLGYIYLALMDITSNFHSHMKSSTFIILQELSKNDVDFEYYDYCYGKKNIQDLRLLQAVYTKSKIEENIATTVFPKETEMYKLHIEHFRNCLEYVRYIDSVDIWIIFIEDENGEYDILIQGNTMSSIDISKIAVKNNGTGTKKRAKCHIAHSNLEMIINDAKAVRRNSIKKTQILL